VTAIASLVGPGDSALTADWAFDHNYATNTTFASPATLSVSGGVAQMNAGSTAGFDSDGRILSAAEWSLTGSSIYGRVDIEPTDAAKIEMGLLIKATGEGIDPSNYLAISYSEGTFYMLYSLAGSVSVLGTPTYSATSHAWWRLREASGTIFWETAPDSSGVPGTWTSQGSVSTATITASWSIATVKADWRRRNMTAALTSSSTGWVKVSKINGGVVAAAKPDPLFMLANLF
jgi:hypothetical protein